VPAGTAAPLPDSTGSPTLCSQVGPLVYYRYLVIVLRIPGNSVADLDPGSGAFLTPGSGGMGKISDLDPGGTTRIIFPRA
jgi:hypothetical protein